MAPWTQELVHASVPVVVGVLAWAAHALINWLVWWSSHEDWDRWAGANPKRAFVVRLVRAFGPHVRDAAKAWSKYLEDQARLRGVDASKLDPPG